MEMTNEEIVRNYHGAKFQRKQVTILAELNLCSRSKIVDILIEGGVDPAELPALPKYKRGSPYSPTEQAVQGMETATPGRRRGRLPYKKTAAEKIEAALERYEHLKLAHGADDPYVLGFKACIDFMEGK